MKLPGLYRSPDDAGGGAGSAVVNKLNSAISAAAPAKVDEGVAVADPDAVMAEAEKKFTDNDVIGISSTEEFASAVETSMNADPAKPAESAVPAAKPAAEVEKPAAKVEAPTKKWKLGTREFDTAEQLEAFASGLDANKADLAAQFAGIQAGLKPAEPEVDPADIIFEDPKKAVALIESRVEAKFKAELLARDRATNAVLAEKRAYNEFYAEHPELKDFDSQVRETLPGLIKAKGWNDSTPFSVWAKELGAKVNADLDRIAEKRRPGVALSNKPAVTSTGDPAKVERAAPEPQVVDFSAQIRQARTKGRLANS